MLESSRDYYALRARWKKLMTTDTKPDKVRRLQLNINVEGDDKEDIADKLRDIADTIDRDIENDEIPTKREH